MAFLQERGRTLNGTENYLWSSKDNLGKGAYGEVYKCRHRKTGDLAAVKLFKGYSQTDRTEIDILQRLNHPNIIKVLAVENFNEGHMRKVAMIMEYCSGKSLNHFLEEPQNCYGMDDKYFLILLRDIVAALRYLQSPEDSADRVIHRDIKPLNILMSYTDNGQPIFKLSDFGTAKVIAATQEECCTLVGTPEYLQPDMFDHYTHQPHYIKGVFDSRAVDLWPLGASIYYAACGSLPFRPFGPLQDSAVKRAMCDMILHKGKGVISGVQESFNGEFIYSDKLPATCRLSKHLQSLIVPLLAELLVAKPRSDFDLFTMVDNIMDRKYVRYFIPHTGVLDCIYLPGDLTPEKLWDEITSLHSESELPRSNFALWWKGFPLDQERELSQFDSVLELEPVMLIGSSFIQKFSTETPLMMNISKFSSLVDRSDPSEDKKFARMVTGNILRMLDDAEHLRDIQLHMNKCARYLDAFFKSRVATVHSPTVNLMDIATRVAVMFNSLKAVRDALPGNSGVESMNKLFHEIEEMCLKANSIHRCSQELNLNKSSNVWTDEDLCMEECEHKLKTQAHYAKEIFNDFKADLDLLKETRTMDYGNRDLREWAHVHKLDKMQLKTLHETSVEHITKKCVPNTKRVSEKLCAWSEDIYKKLDSVDRLEKDFEDLSKLQEKLQQSTEKFGDELSNYIKNKVRNKKESLSEKNEIFERARLALEESGRTLAEFNRRSPTRIPRQSWESFGHL